MASGRCKHHTSQDAVAQCRGCGAFICDDCFEMYGVTSGDYAGQALCYDCTSQLVAANVADVESHRKRVTRELVITGIGATAGAIIGFPLLSEPGAGLWFFVLIGLGAAIGMLGKAIRALFDGAYGMMFIYLLGAPIIAIRNLFRRLNQIKQAKEIIASDSQVLAEMRDYFAYTQAMERADDAKGFDALTAEGGELFGNSYARSVKAKGEQAAQAELRKGVVQISANGEIIRGFDPERKPKRGAA